MNGCQASNQQRFKRYNIIRSILTIKREQEKIIWTKRRILLFMRGIIDPKYINFYIHMPAYTCMCLFLAKKNPIQADVVDEVCCPANSKPISMPAISSSVSWRPDLQNMYINIWSGCECTRSTVLKASFSSKGIPFVIKCYINLHLP